MTTNRTMNKLSMLTATTVAMLLAGCSSLQPQANTTDIHLVLDHAPS